MSGGHIAKFKKFFRLRLLLALLLNGVTIVAISMALDQYMELSSTINIGIIGLVVIILAVIQSHFLANELAKPMEYVAQAIFHISPHEHLVEAPNIEKIRFGRELVASLTRQIYDYAAASQATLPKTNATSDRELALLDTMSVAIIGLDDKNNITLVNAYARDNLGLRDANGLSLKSQLTMKFSGKTLEEWFIEVKSKSINANASWTKVEVSSSNGSIRNFYDIAASFKAQNASGIEKIIVLFDHSDIFDEEDEALNLVAMSVHEIRTPLTILRGYIETLRDELDGKVDAQTKQYIDRLSASSESLAAFMANVLSVVRSDQSQMSLQLQETDWNNFITESINNLQTRASVRGKNINLSVAKNLPKAAVDAISLNEVVTNLVDNAIKYSPPDKKTIWVESTINSEGSILTTVRDEGVGIPDSVVPNLFTRFYRNRRNKLEISGTGLGLYISKEIVSAHHGNIWVNSKEGEGTTVSFTVIPFTRLADVEETSDNTFKQVGHGWIKNHGMQRR